jgi:uncharacterized linocin/CFP29 family protein
MNHLLRERAPITEAGWDLLDEEARERLTPVLAARKLVDFSGPHGWDQSATNLGRVTELDSVPVEGLNAATRRVLPLVEVRAPFEISRSELRAADRGARDVDLGPLDRATYRIACAENIAVLHGWPGAFVGIAEASSLAGPPLGDSPEAYPDAIAGALVVLREAGIGGPYAIALGPEQYRRVLAAGDRGGYPLLEHLGKILDGPILPVPGIVGATVISVRGGDFRFESGQDLSIGYESHDADVVRLYLEESFSFHVATPEAAVALLPHGGATD